MLQLANKYQQAVPAKRHEADSVPQLDLLALLHIFMRRWRLLAIMLGLGLACGVAYMMLAQPRYTADLLILVDPRKNSLLARDTATGEGIIDPGLIESQVEVLKSAGVALTVVQALDLTKDPMIMGKKSDEAGSWFTMPKALSALLAHFKASPSAKPPTQEQLEQIAVKNVTGAIKVVRIGVTYVIQVSLTGTDPVRTAQIANAISNAYVDSQLQARYDATRRAATWLQTRLKSLREETSTAENAVQKYKAENNIVDTARGLMSDQQLGDANAQLASARNATGAAKARLDRIEDILKNTDVVNATVPDALRDDVLNRLRAQYLDLASREADFSARFGANHGAVVNVKNQMNEIAKAARDELGRIAESTRSDYAIAMSNENSIKANLTTLVTQSDATSKAQVKLRDLESSAQTYRNLYDNMLQKLQETTQEQTSPDDSARVITPASVPSGPSAPKLLIVMAASLLGSLGLGCGLVLARELLGTTFKTPDDVKSYAGIECLGTLPLVSISRAEARLLRKAAASNTILGARSPVSRQTVLAPFSRFTETIRNVKVSIDNTRTGRAAVVSGIVSSVPKEGKTTFSANLALLTAQMGHRTLMIDGDMHNPSLTRIFKSDARLGLIDILEGRCKASDAIIKDATTGLDFIPTVIKERRPNSVTLLTSDAMTQLLGDLRERYDYVFVDLPPIVPVVDVKAASYLFDNFVFVLEWGRTSRNVVRDAMMTSEQLRQRVIGAVLNKADPLELKRLESYRGANYGNYYVESNAA